MELENAIAVVEEVVMPVLRQLPPGLALHTHTTPQDNAFAATLLILRELMHHLGFTPVVWMPSLASESTA